MVLLPSRSLQLQVGERDCTVPAGVAVYLDVSLKRFTTVFPACGSSNSAIELTLPQLERYSGCRAWVDVCKGWAEADV